MWESVRKRLHPAHDELNIHARDVTLENALSEPVRETTLPQEPAPGMTTAAETMSAETTSAETTSAETTPVETASSTTVASPEESPVREESEPEGRPRGDDLDVAAEASAEDGSFGETTRGAIDLPRTASGTLMGSASGTMEPLTPLGETEILIGSTIAGRYTVTAIERFDGAPAYRAIDNQAYLQCWSCGSTENGLEARFCHTCGAPLEGRTVLLQRTSSLSGLPGEVSNDDVYLHPIPERRHFGAEGMGVQIGAWSAEGPHHPNEDSYWYTSRTFSADSVRHSLALAVLSDGMGGYAPGSGLISSRVASMVGSRISIALDVLSGERPVPDENHVLDLVREGVAAANRMVVDEVARTGEMGATLIVVIVADGMAYIANLGDSRAYHVDPQGRAIMITSDQSLVGEAVRSGELAMEDMYDAPGSNIVLHAIGEPDAELQADWYALPLEPGSLLLLCTDGYWKTMRGRIDVEVLRESQPLDVMARKLVDEALARGSDDNTSIVAIRVD